MSHLGAKGTCTATAAPTFCPACQERLQYAAHMLDALNVI